MDMKSRKKVTDLSLEEPFYERLSKLDRERENLNL